MTLEPPTLEHTNPYPDDAGPAPTRHHLDREPPRDTEAERLTIGAVLLDPTIFPNLTAHVTASDFYLPRHETIWRALTHLHANDQPLELAALTAHFVDTKTPDRETGGAPYLFDLLQAAPAPASAPFYADRVESLARRRHLIAGYNHGLQKLMTPGDDADVDQLLRDATAHLAELSQAFANPAPPSTWAPVNLEPVLAGEYLDPEPTMLMRGDGVFLLYDGAVHTISGESESGKTWLTLLATVQLLAQHQNVTFLDFEDRADRVIGRLMSLGATHQQLRDHFAYVRPDRPLDDDGRTALAPHLTGRRLVIIDGVTEAMTTHGFDLNSNADSALFQALLPRWIADHGPAVVLIDHVVKDKEKQDRFALGAQHKLAGIDGVAYIVKMIQPFARGKRGLARIEIAKDRPGHVRGYAHGRTIAEFTLDATASDVVLIATLNPPADQANRGGDTFEPTIFMERISRFVQTNPGLSKKAIEDTVNGKSSTKRLALELLVTRGYIGTKAGPKNSVQHYHQKPYYADPDQDPANQPDDPFADDTNHPPEAS